MKLIQLANYRLLIFLAFAFPLFIACKKDPPKKNFKVRTTTWYRVAPTAPTPIEVNGTTYIAAAYFPGGGSGNATHMGNVTYYFNQLTYAASAGAPPAGSVSAPIIDVLNYPVIGGPLPLIQQGDFTGLAGLQTLLQIPAEVNGLVVNAVLVSKNGDAVFTSAITGSGSTFPLSPTRVGFNGKAYITGGRGKFENAFGEINYEGAFSIIDPNDAEYNAEGWISY